jgi:HEAT repeat protein
MLGGTLLALAVAGGCGHKSADEEYAGSGTGSGEAAQAGWPLSYWQPKLADKEITVRADAARAIGRMRSAGKPAVPDLIQLLDDKQIGVRTAAAYALGRIGPDAAAAVPALTKTREPPETDRNGFDLRAAAAVALGSIGPQAKPAIPALVKALAYGTQAQMSAGPELRACAIYALWAIGPDGVAALKQEAGSAPTPAVALALKATGPNTVAVLTEALGNGLQDREVAHWLHWAVGRTPGTAAEAMPALQKALRSGGESVSWAGVILREIGPQAKAAIPDLVQALERSNTGSDTGIVDTLAELGPDAIAVLADEMYFGYSTNRIFTVRALWSMGPAALPALEKALPDLPPDSSREAIGFLASQGSEGEELAKRVGQAARDRSAKTASSPRRSTREPSLRERGERKKQFNNLKQISMAMLNYESSTRRFPQAGVERDAAGKPVMSWRVALLPYLDHLDLYRQYRPNEPWDSPNNLKLLDRMPDVYRSRGVVAPDKTSIVVFTGRRAPFSPQRQVRFSDIRDGTSNTLMLIEAGPEKAVPWTKPEDVPFRPSDPRVALGSARDGVFLVAFFDGYVRTLPADLDPAVFRALITPDGAEAIDRSAFDE